MDQFDRTPEDTSRWRIERRAFAVGYPHSEFKCSEVYQYGWNFSFEEPLTAVVASLDDDGTILADAAAKIQLAPEHEYSLLSQYSTVINRYYDGLWIRILSTRIDPDEMQKQLQEASDGTIGKSITRMPRSSWP